MICRIWAKNIEKMHGSWIGGPPCSNCSWALELPASYSSYFDLFISNHCIINYLRHSPIMEEDGCLLIAFVFYAKFILQCLCINLWYNYLYLKHFVYKLQWIILCIIYWTLTYWKTLILKKISKKPFEILIFLINFLWIWKILTYILKPTNFVT